MDDQFDELPPSPERTSMRKHKIKDLKQSQSQIPRNEADQFKITKSLPKGELVDKMKEYTFNNHE